MSVGIKRMCFNVHHIPDGWGLFNLIWVKKVYVHGGEEQIAFNI